MRVSRTAIIHGFLLLFASAILAKAVHVQIVQRDIWAARAKHQHYKLASLPGVRGEILDATGSVLVESRELTKISVAPREVKDIVVLRRVLKRVGVEPRWIAAATDTKRKWVDIPTLFQPKDIAVATALRGVHSASVIERVYSPSSGIRRIVGRVDAVSAKPVDGIELSLDEVLRGDTGRVSVARNKEGKQMEAPSVQDDNIESGHTVVLTINRGLQDIVERALSDAVDSLGASGGDIVVLNPHTGDVLAMASRRADPRAVANTAVTEPFEPGSTLKPFIAAKLLELKRARADEVISTYNGQMKMPDGRVITDVHKASELSLADVIRYSSNIGIVRFSERLTPREKYETLRDAGFGAPTGIQLPAETPGTLREPAKWSRTSAASVVMGYEIAVTPLQLVAGYAAFANGGELLEPHIIKEIRDADGKVIYKSEKRVLRRIMPEAIAKDVQRMLLAVVQEGTGVKADLANFFVGGKSGTARRTVNGRYEAGSYTASFIGLFPGDKPQYVVLVKLDNPKDGYYGGVVAGSVTNVVLRAALAARDAALNREELASAERMQEPDTLATPKREPATEPESAQKSIAAVSAAPVATLPAQQDSSLKKSYVINLPAPRKVAPAVAVPRPVPDVSKMSLRNAVRVLHSAGFRVKLDRSFTGVSPAAGTMAAPGSIVYLGRVIN